MDPIFQQMRDQANRDQDAQERLHVQDREVLFENEKFVIGVLQVVSAGSIVAAIGQAEQIIRLTSDGTIRWLVTLACVSLFLALAAAVSKHQYKMWDVKTRAIDAASPPEEVQRRQQRTARFLKLMRLCMWGSFIVISLDLLQLVVALWRH
jgi:hypothetical protein